MKNKKLAMLIGILIIVLIIILFVICVIEKKDKELEITKNNNPQLTVNLDIKEVNTEREFFLINDCINNFFIARNDNDPKKVFYMLDDEYKKDEGISIENVLEKTDILDGDFCKFFAKMINCKQISFQQRHQYYVYGELYANDYKSKIGLYIIVNLNFVDNSFSIQFGKDTKMSVEDYNNIISEIKEGNTGEFINVKESENSSIELNEYNAFINESSERPEMLENYLNYYIITAVYYPEYAYNELLDKDYRDTKFQNLQEYKTYIQKNKNNILNSSISQYSISEKEDYTEYIIMDNKDNFYALKVKGVMDYKVVLDFYTIDFEQIVEKYDDASDQEKVAINIQKIVSAIKDKDYKYVYGKLNDNFKNNNYDTLEKFENEMERVYTGRMKLTFKEFSNEGNTYIYNINLKGTTASNNKETNMQIIMQLKEDRDFVMSFSIK